MYRYLGLAAGLLGVLLLLLPDEVKKDDPVNPDPVVVVTNGPTKAFDTYEKLWRKHAGDAADKIKAGELKTDKQVWEFIANGQAPARQVAFDELAKMEQEYFTKNGGWTAELHEKLLRDYANGK